MWVKAVLSLQWFCFQYPLNIGFVIAVLQYGEDFTGWRPDSGVAKRACEFAISALSLVAMKSLSISRRVAMKNGAFTSAMFMLAEALLVYLMYFRTRSTQSDDLVAFQGEQELELP